MKHRLSILVFVLVSLLLTAIPASQVNAAGGFILFTGMTSWSCTGNSQANWTSIVPAGETQTRNYNFTNLRTGTSYGFGGFVTTGPAGPYGSGVLFPPPAGTAANDHIRVTLVASYSAGYTFTTTITFNCTTGQVISITPGGEAPGPKWFAPGDDRVDPRPGDRLSVYCDVKDKIDVWGIDHTQNDTEKGFRLTTFSYKEVKAAGDNGITKNLGKYGSVSISLKKGWFWVAWNGGPFGANGRGIWVKNFPETMCTFAK